MNRRIIKSLIRKDLTLFFKNRFIVLITFLGLVFFIILYFVMPKSIEDKMGLGIYTNLDLKRALIAIESEDVEIVRAKSIDELKALVSKEEVIVGFVFPDDLMEKAGKGETITMQIYTASDIEPELKEAIDYIGKEMIFTELGYGLNIESKSEILGPDLAGKQIPPSKRIVPVFAFFLIIMETLGLANLISDEVERKTIHALLATPATVQDIFVSKGVVGLLTTLIPALLFMFVTIGFKSFLPIFVILLAGSIFAMSIGFLIGSIGRDIMSVIAWGVMFFIILIIPAFNVMAPGTLTSWVKAIPSSYLVESLHRVINFQEGFKDIYKSLAVLLGSSVVLFTISTFALRRRFE